MPHGQQRHHQLVGVGLGEPGHVVVDDAFDRVAGIAQLAAQTRRLRRSRASSAPRPVRRNCSLKLDHVLAQRRDVFGVSLIDRRPRWCRGSAARAAAPARSSTTRSSLGAAVKSFTVMRIAAIALLKSRLASASAPDCLTVCEGVADLAFAGRCRSARWRGSRPPGCSASTMMRVRTENVASSRVSAIGHGSGNCMKRMEPGSDLAGDAACARCAP